MQQYQSLLAETLSENTRQTEGFHEYMCCFPLLPSMLVSQVCLGINFFKINIEGKGKKNNFQQ